MQEAGGVFQPVLGFFAAYPYLMLFVGLVLVGEAVLLPALYLAGTERLEWLSVLAVAVAATMLSDFVWYLLGRWYPEFARERVRRQQSPRLFLRLEALFVQKGALLLYLSKFVYGTRIAAQVLSGVFEMPPGRWLVVNLAAVVSITLLLAVLAFGVVDSVQRLEDLVAHVELAFLLFVLLAVAAYLIVGVVVRRQWFRS